MAVDAEKCREAEQAFLRAPTPANAADYFSKLREAEENGELSDGEFHDGLGFIETYLWELAK